MNYPIPANSKDIVDLRQQSVSPDLVAAAIVGTIQVARAEGRSLEDLINEVLIDDALLDSAQRRWLSDVVAVAWRNLAQE